jgi:hypothetical protein
VSIENVPLPKRGNTFRYHDFESVGTIILNLQIVNNVFPLNPSVTNGGCRSVAEDHGGQIWLSSYLNPAQNLYG